MLWKLFIGASALALFIVLAIPFGSIIGIPICPKAPTTDPACIQVWVIAASNWGAGILTMFAGAFIFAVSRIQIAAEDRRRSEATRDHQGQAFASAAGDLREAQERLASQTIPEAMVFADISIPDIDTASGVLGMALRTCLREVSDKISVLRFIKGCVVANLPIEDFDNGLIGTRFRMALLATILGRCSTRIFSGGSLSVPPFIEEEEALKVLNGHIGSPKDFLYLRPLVRNLVGNTKWSGENI